VASNERVASHPDIPAIAETLPGYYAAGWFGLVAPAGTPKPIIDRLNREIADILNTPETRSSMVESGLEPRVMSPAEFGQMLGSEFAKYTKVFNDEGIKPE
jgi:tripartite-type tricarboxylate transporter receptor subunit TctC